MNQPKKITLFLADGEPDGIRTLSLGGWSGLGLVFPRNKLKDMGRDPMAQRPAVYFLFGRESEESLVLSAYIGEAEKLFDRLTTHNADKNKDFWHMTVAFVASDDSLTKAHVKYLESRAATLAAEAGHFGYVLKNGKESSLAHLHPSDVPVMEEFIAHVRLLLAAIGYPILQRIETKTDSDAENPVFSCQSKNGAIKATARMTNEGFIVYKDSTAAVEQAPSITAWSERLAEKLLEENVIERRGGIYRFLKDYKFSSPSAAASFILGHSVNGWDAWKTEEGKTLNAVYRTSGK